VVISSQAFPLYHKPTHQALSNLMRATIKRCYNQANLGNLIQL